MNVRELEPKKVWNFFEDLNAVPRPSKKEEKIIEINLRFIEIFWKRSSNDATIINGKKNFNSIE